MATYTFEPPTTPVTDTPSIIGGNRLEPRTRSAEFNRSLRAEVRDAAWMLARQWQLKEFRAEDRGSPVGAAISVEIAPLNQLKIGQQGVASYPDGLLPQPLDVMVQAQNPIVDWGMRLQMGNQWARLLRYQQQQNAITSTRVAELLVKFRQRYPFDLPSDAAGPDYNLAYGVAQTATEAYTLLQGVGPLDYEGQRPTGFDGYRLLQELLSFNNQSAYDAFLAGIGVSGSNSAEAGLIDTVIEQFVAWYRRVYYQHDLYGQDLAAWSVKDLAYRFQAAAPSSQGAVVVEAREHLGDGLDWYTVDEIDPKTALEFANEGKAETIPSYAVPSEIQFPGAPNARWWEFEDRQVDFGQITADSSDLGRMLMQEFMFLYQNDWFSVPYTVPMGSLCTVRELTITDAFGLRYAIKPAGDNRTITPDSTQPIDEDWGRWSMYALSRRNNRQSSSPRILVPPTAIGTLVGPVVEQVYLAREEATNLVWGVEQIVPDQLGRGMDGSGAAARVGEYLRSRAQPVVPLATAATLEYRLNTPTTENWIPFVPRVEGTLLAPDSYLALAQGEMLRQVDGLVLREPDQTIKPRTSLLKYPEDVAYLVHERQVPPVGVRLEGNYRRARWFDGATYTWYGRSRSNGRDGGSSGLAYDQLLPREARTTPVSFALTEVTYEPYYATSNTANPIRRIKAVRVRELDATGTPLASPPAPELELTRAQLVRMLTAEDTFRILNANDPVVLATVGTKVYVQRQSLGAARLATDALGNLPTYGNQSNGATGVGAQLL
jgi:hypothetical protein